MGEAVAEAAYCCATVLLLLCWWWWYGRAQEGEGRAARPFGQYGFPLKATTTHPLIRLSGYRCKLIKLLILNMTDTTSFIIGKGFFFCIRVYAYTHVSMRIWVLIFCDFSSFLVWKRLQDFRLNKMSPFSQEK